MKQKLIFTTSTRRIASRAAALFVAGSLLLQSSGIAEANRQVLVRDITSVEGIRDNMLVGYGLVVGLSGTGDRQQTIFTVQTLANAMQKMGVLISPTSVVVKNVAAVFITASLPPFARPGAKMDVTVSSVGDAKSLEGGVLLMSALHGPDGQVYAEAQGPLVLGGYSAGSGANGKQVNATTVGIIPAGAIIERDTSVDLSGFKTVSLLLRNPDFTTATSIADAVNGEFHRPVASALDSSRVDVNVAEASAKSVPVLISRVQNLALSVRTPAKIVINERTGTIVMGGDVKLSPVSVIHGSLSIQVVTHYEVSQPTVAPFKGNAGKAVVVPQTTVNVNDPPAQSMRLDEGANVDELVAGLHAIGTTARDVVAILQAIKAEGGMQAELEVQ
ncbi:MAG TPA: flagellar basal body P-ring protein FlgI [Acidobacteriaceae bacterium]|nr:flagellar basal body P-ring protein FlgI [Acidobacteriaceae bacterium]